MLVDDYDLVATGRANPLAPLLDYLSQARDVGLHLVADPPGRRRRRGPCTSRSCSGCASWARPAW